MLEAHPDLKPCAVHCAHCDIRFLTHARNAGRRNLRCPFGCRDRHRRLSSSQRSKAYRQTASGKAKKKQHNLRRRRAASAELPAVPENEPQTSPAASIPPTTATVDSRRDGVVLDESSLTNSPMLPYVRMAVSLIEGVHIKINELLDLLRRALRQRSIDSPNGEQYVLRFPWQHPP